MDTNDIQRNIDQKRLPDYNMNECETKQIQENLIYLGFPNRNKLLYKQSKQNANLSNLENLKNKRNRKLEDQKENIQGNGIKASIAMKTSEQRKKGDSVCEPTSEGKAFKRRMLQMPENHSSPDAQEKDLVKVDTGKKTAQDKNTFTTDENKYLPPGLTDLVLKPTKDKICRPPNAFMLFAKEHRSSVSADDPRITNGQRSHLLGSMWRSMSGVDKEKYYRDANALQKLHKDTYPNYIYSPREARKQKQVRRENRLQLKKALLERSVEPNPTSDDSRGKGSRNRKSQKNESKAGKSVSVDVESDYVCSPSETKVHKEIGSENSLISKKALILRLTKSSSTPDGGPAECLMLNTKSQEIESKAAQNNSGEIKGDSRYEMPRQPLSGKSENLPDNPFQSPLYYPKSREEKMKMAEYSAPCHYCPIHGFNRRYVEHNHSDLTSKENSPTPSTSRESFPAIQNPYFQPFHPLFNNNFHPAVWNPWMMWPGSYYNPVTGADFHENWMKFGLPEHLKKQNTRRQNEKKAEATATSDYPAHDPFPTLLKDQPTNVLSGPTENEAKPSAASGMGCSAGGSEDDDFKPLFIDDGAEDESFCGGYKK